MARFASAAELESFLRELEPDYAQYATALWQHQVRTAHQLANASKKLLLSWGLLELHVDDIKARANSAGEHLQCSLYATYSECLWAKEVNCAAQLGNASVPVMHACGVENPVHAGDIIAQSKATGKWFYCRCNLTPVQCPTSK